MALERNKEKYTVMGELSADMAHEIRNPLGSIELLASLLKKESKRKKDINRANQIIAAVKTMENKISQLIHRFKNKPDSGHIRKYSRCLEGDPAFFGKDHRWRNGYLIGSVRRY